MDTLGRTQAQSEVCSARYDRPTRPPALSWDTRGHIIERSKATALVLLVLFFIFYMKRKKAIK